MKLLALAFVLLVGAERIAHADGWIHCGPQKCNASGADSSAVATSLLLVAGVAHVVGRRKRR